MFNKFFKSARDKLAKNKGKDQQVPAAPPPPPPPPGPSQADLDIIANDKRKKAARERTAQGRKSTIATSGLGISEEAAGAKKTLLGQ